ncbi:MAG: hypothetical protein CMK92_15675 [Pseudomonas sp.]|nr:hypothetical protein [Pseudomonas sp.]
MLAKLFCSRAELAPTKNENAANLQRLAAFLLADRHQDVLKKLTVTPAKAGARALQTAGLPPARR